MRLVASVLCALLLCGVAYATPAPTSTSGTMADGETVTITGSGFGTKSPAAPLVYDDFEDGAADVTASALGRVNWGGLEEQTVLDNVVYGGAYAVHHTYTSGEDVGNFWVLDNTLGDASKIYVYLVRRWDGTFDNAATNMKILRIYPAAGGLPDLVVTFHGTAILGGWGPAYNAAVEACDNPIFPTGYQKNNWPVSGTWYPEEYVVQFSSATDAADGTYTHYRTGTELVTASDVTTRCSGYTAIPQKIYIDGYQGGTGFVGDVYEDSIYVDNTWARTMLCTGATWAARATCEIQPASAWSDTEVTVTINQGNFADDATAYLYVVDADGAANADGLEVTFGAEVPVPVPCISIYYLSRPYWKNIGQGSLNSCIRRSLHAANP